MQSELSKWLERQAVCPMAINWVGGRTARQAWDECPRADWMLWSVGRLVERKVVVRAACACARTALRYSPETEKRPLHCIDTAEAWCDGRATIEEVKDAAAAATTFTKHVSKFW